MDYLDKCALTLILHEDLRSVSDQIRNSHFSICSVLACTSKEEEVNNKFALESNNYSDDLWTLKKCLDLCGPAQNIIYSQVCILQK